MKQSSGSSPSATLFTVAGPDIGLGHLSRCDALAQALVELGAGTKLVVCCSAGAKWLEERAPETEWRLENWLDNAQAIRAERGSSILVFDAYDTSQDVWDAINRLPEPVVFDDFGSNIPRRGTLINGGPGAGLIDYPRASRLTLLLGTDYQVLRPPFWERSQRTISGREESIGVALGGGTTKAEMQSILHLVMDSFHSDITVYALGVTENMVGTTGARATGYLAASEVKALFDRLDLLVTAAGQTVAEAVSCALPTVMIQTAPNQEYNVKGWKSKGAVRYAGRLSDSAIQVRLREELPIAATARERERLSRNASSCALHDSTRRLAASLLRHKAVPKLSDG